MTLADRDGFSRDAVVLAPNGAELSGAFDRAPAGLTARLYRSTNRTTVVLTVNVDAFGNLSVLAERLHERRPAKRLLNLTIRGDRA